MPRHRNRFAVVYWVLAGAVLLLVSLFAHRVLDDHPGWEAHHIVIAVATILLAGLGILQARSVRALRRLYRDLHALMEGTPQVLISIDIHGNAIRWNDRLLGATGLSSEQLRGIRITDLFEPASRPAVIQAIDTALTEGAYECDLPLLHRGRPREFAWMFTRDDSGDSDSGITISGRDVSDRRIAERKLEQTESEQRRLEEALRRSEADYRGLFEHAHDAILILDPLTEVALDANRQSCMLYDFPQEQLIGKSMIELSVDPVRRHDFVHRTLEENGEYLPLESQQYRRDGSIIDVEIRAAKVMYRGREAILSINRDVTARKREERRVRESEERFRLLLESVVDYAIYMLDPDGCVVSWNEGAERIFGFSAADVLGRSFAMFYTPESQAAGAPARDLAAAAESGRIAREEQQVRKDGSSFHSALVLTRVVDEEGVLRGFAKVNHDITEKIRLEQTEKQILATIRNVAAEWTRTFDAVTVPILLLDDDARIRRLNAAAARLAGKPLRTLLKIDVHELEGQPWQTIGALANFFRIHGVPTGRRAVDEKTGRVWQVSLTPVDLGGQRHVITVAYDLTLVAQLEESLRRTELTAALGGLVAGVAHEVRNPLFTISATLDACEARLGSVPGLREYLSPLRDEITRLNDLMQDLLDYGKPHPLDVAEISLVDVARAAIAQSCAGNRRGVEVILDCAGHVPSIHGDEGRLQQVLRNVIENAIQHSQPESRVVVRVRNDGSGVRCEVVDSGRGLSAEDLARAFVPFYTRRMNGTGLGLSIAQKIVAAHGGEITLRNRETGGAVVTVLIPLDRCAPFPAAVAN